MLQCRGPTVTWVFNIQRAGIKALNHVVRNLCAAPYYFFGTLILCAFYIGMPHLKTAPVIFRLP